MNNRPKPRRLKGYRYLIPRAYKAISAAWAMKKMPGKYRR